MTREDAKSAKRSNQTMNCKYCNTPIRPGQVRTPLQSGGAMHEDCGIRTTGKAEDFLFYCHDCDFATDKIDVVQACPNCESARAGLVPPASLEFWKFGNDSLAVCDGCFEPFHSLEEYRAHECHDR